MMFGIGVLLMLISEARGGDEAVVGIAMVSGDCLTIVWVNPKLEGDVQCFGGGKTNRVKAETASVRSSQQHFGVWTVATGLRLWLANVIH